MRLRRIVEISLLALLPMVVTAGDADPVYDIPRLDDVVVDGNPADWGDGGFHIELLQPVDTRDSRLPMKPVANHDAQCRLAWNGDGLLILMTVRDNAWVEPPGNDQIGAHDAMEFYMAPERGSKDICQWVVSPGMAAAAAVVRTRMHDYRKEKALKKLPMDMKVARTRDGDTCVLEALLPLHALGVNPEEGETAAIQLWSRDSDSAKRTEHYFAVWHPRVGSFRDSTRMNAIRLSRQPSPPIVALTSGGYDMRRVRSRLDVTARTEQIGKPVRVLDGDRLLASGTLEADDGGRASANLSFAFLDQGAANDTLAVEVAGLPAQRVRMPDPRRTRAEAILFECPVAEASVFSGPGFPEIEYRRPLWMERLIGPYTIKATYYDADYHVVTEAAEPGRYGAVVEVTPENGRMFRRFLSLYRAPEGVNWWRLSLDANVTFPSSLGVTAEAVAAYPKAVSEFVKWRIAEGVGQNGGAAVLLAGLHETDGAPGRDDFYTAPAQKDRQWWVGLKRKLYGWDARWPKAFVCPTPAKGSSATVIREGTPAEAGMRPDAGAQIDAVLTQWANDTDEAFAVCIVRHGVIVLHKAYGMRDGEPMALTTKSWMASTTKMISGTCMMMLVDQGLIDLDDRIDTYLPALKGVKTSKPLTIRHLYTHTSGLDWHWGADESDMEERIAELLPLLEVGERYSYNGTGMELGCKILEAVTGESLPQFYRRHLLGPLGCDNTDIPNASSGAASVPLDMARIGQMLLNKGAYGGMRFFSEATHAEMLPRKLTTILGPDTKSVYGIGTSFMGGPGLSGSTYAHGAASSATTRIDPENDLVISMTRDRAGRNFRTYHDKFIEAITAGMTE